MDVSRERLVFGAIFFVVLVGFANTTFHALAGSYAFAGANGAASVVAVWALYLIFVDRV